MGLLLVSEFLQVGVLHHLRCCVPLIRVINNHLHYQILAFSRNVRNQFGYSDELLLLEVEIHVSRQPSNDDRKVLTLRRAF